MKPIAIVALTLLIAAAVAAPAHAQIYQGGPLGALYATTNAASYVGELGNIPLATPFTFYLVIDIDFADIGAPEQNSSNGLLAWDGRVTAPAGLTIIGNTVSPASSVDIGTKSAPTYDYIVGTGQLVQVGAPVPVVTFQALLLAPTTDNIIVRVGRPALGSIPDAPAWGEAVALNGCESSPGRATQCLFAFAETRNLVLNSGEIDNDETSFGSLKSRFD